MASVRTRSGQGIRKRSSATIPPRSAYSLPATLGNRGHQPLLLLRERLQKIHEWHLLVELRVADRDGCLVREDGYGLFIVVGEKVGVAAQENHRAENALVIAQRQSIHAVELVGFKERSHLCAGIFRRGVPAVVVHVQGHGVFLIGDPFEAIAQLAHLAGFRDFLFAGDGAENESAAVEKADHELVERDYGSSLLRDGGKNVVEIECGSDFLRNFEKRVERVDFALGFEEVRVVQSDGGLLADAFEEEEIFFVERSAVGFIYDLDDAQHFVFLAQRGGHPGLNLELAARFDAFFEARFFRRRRQRAWDCPAEQFRRASLR